jgi:hypothetical protein
MAEEAQEYHSSLETDCPLLISVIISENALQDTDRMNEYLDALTALEVAGFYLIIDRNSSAYRFTMGVTPLENLLYLAYVLGEINQYNLVVGYTDWLGILLQAVGVRKTAFGWFQNLRQFSFARYRPSMGGRRPRARYASIPLLNNILITPELEDIHMQGLMEDVLSGTTFDRLLMNGPTRDPWTDNISCLHHWETLSNIFAEIGGLDSLEDRIDRVSELIRNADRLYLRLQHENISFDPDTRFDHLHEWREALDRFRGTIGI